MRGPRGRVMLRDQNDDGSETMAGTGAQEILTLGGVLIDAAKSKPEADALIFPDQRLRYGELYAAARRWARVFMALGVEPREHIGLQLHTCPEFVEAMFGAALAGAVTVPINARYVAGELRYILENGDLVTVVTTDEIAEAVDFVGRLTEAFPDIPNNRDAEHLRVADAPKLRNVVVLGSGQRAGFVPGTSLDALAARVSEDALDRRIAAVSPDDVSLIIYTSGTTSNPKGCLLQHKAIVGNSRRLADVYEITGHDRLWSPLPFFHIGGILPMVTIFDVKGAYITLPKFDAGVSIDLMERERASVTYPCFITIMQDLINHPRWKEADLRCVRLMNSSPGVQPEALRIALEAKLPQTVHVGTYGLTEGSGSICTNRPSDSYEARIKRLGGPKPGWEVRVVDFETGIDVPTGQHGEILARGPGLMMGYYKDPVKTAATLDKDGWLHTGDIGSLDALGHILFHGRVKDMLKVGGENVAAAEVEAVLNTHPAVKLSQVVGAPDDRLAEVVAAYVELNPGKSATEAELIAHCRGKVASFKLPRYVRFISDWPMSTSKIQKFRLRQMIGEELAQRGQRVTAAQ